REDHLQLKRGPARRSERCPGAHVQPGRGALARAVLPPGLSFFVKVPPPRGPDTGSGAVPRGVTTKGGFTNEEVSGVRHCAARNRRGGSGRVRLQLRRPLQAAVSGG